MRILVFLFALISCALAVNTVKVSLGESIQDAINSLPNDTSPAIIEVKSGTYNQNITVARPNIVLKASSSDGVILSNPVLNYSVIWIDYAAENFTIYDFAFINTAAEEAGNQNAIRAFAPRLAMYNCKLIAFKDTAYFAQGSGYLYNTYIEGTVDFIYGASDLYIYKSTIASSGRGYTTAASTACDDLLGGFVINKAKFKPVLSTLYDLRYEGEHSYHKPLLESEWNSSVYFGRPWHYGPRTYILQSSIMGHIKPLGWYPWHYTDEELATIVVYAEYGNTGPGADTSDRVWWSKQLTKEEAEPYLLPPTYFERLGLGTDWIDPEYLE